MSASPNFESAFKPTAGGWIFAPSLAFAGPWFASRFGTHYLVDDDRKAALTDTLRAMMRQLRLVCLVYALLCGIAAVAMVALLVAWLLLPALPQLPPLPAMPGGAAIFFGIVMLPFAVVIAGKALTLRRQLAGAPRAAGTISRDDYLDMETASQSMQQLRTQFAVSLLMLALFLVQFGRAIAAQQIGWSLLWLAILAVVGAGAVRAYRLMTIKRRAATNP